MIASERMPPEWSETRSKITCNDCSAKSEVVFHFTGLKCLACGSYNTVSLGLINPPQFTVGQQPHPQQPEAEMDDDDDEEEEEDDEEDDEEERK